MNENQETLSKDYLNKLRDILLWIQWNKKVALYAIIEDDEKMQSITVSVDWYTFKEMCEHPHIIAVLNDMDEQERVNNTNF